VNEPPIRKNPRPRVPGKGRQSTLLEAPDVVRRGGKNFGRNSSKSRTQSRKGSAGKRDSRKDEGKQTTGGRTGKGNFSRRFRSRSGSGISGEKNYAFHRGQNLGVGRRGQNQGVTRRGKSHPYWRERGEKTFPMFTPAGPPKSKCRGRGRKDTE